MTNLNLEAATNADWREAFAVVDPDGAAVGLAGAAIRMDLRDRGGASALSLSLGEGLSLADPAAGALDLEVDEATMAMLTPQLYRFDLLIEIGELRLTVARGTVNVRAGVTQWPG